MEQAARAAGVHRSTLARWAAGDRRLQRIIRDAQHVGWRATHRGRWRRPSVTWRQDCPVCGAPVTVASAWHGAFRFWRCERWPACRWVSWRPPAPGQCPRCGGDLYWSHSRLTVGCPRCGYRDRIATRDRASSR